MRVRVVSDVLEETYDNYPITAEWAVTYLSGAGEFLVPGVNSWDNVQAEHHRYDHGDQLVITADLDHDEVVPEGHTSGTDGTPVTEEFVSEYIRGADVYWLAPGVMKASEVTFV